MEQAKEITIYFCPHCQAINTESFGCCRNCGQHLDDRPASSRHARPFGESNAGPSAARRRPAKRRPGSTLHILYLCTFGLIIFILWSLIKKCSLMVKLAAAPKVETPAALSTKTSMEPLPTPNIYANSEPTLPRTACPANHLQTYLVAGGLIITVVLTCLACLATARFL